MHNARNRVKPDNVATLDGGVPRAAQGQADDLRNPALSLRAELFKAQLPAAMAEEEHVLTKRRSALSPEMS